MLYESPRGQVTKQELHCIKKLYNFDADKFEDESIGRQEAPWAYLNAVYGQEVLDSLVSKKLIKGSKYNSYKLLKGVSGMFKPSNKPITPGVRKPYISSMLEDDQFGHIPINALDILASRPSVINKFMAQKIKDADWDEKTPDAVIRAARKTAYETKLYHDSFCDWRGRVYCQTGEYGSIHNSKVVRAMIDAPNPESVDRNSNAFRYMLTVIGHEYGVTPKNFREVRESTITVPSDAAKIRAAHAIYEVVETGQTAYLMEQDASCSGGQIIALLTGDSKLAAATNCIKREGKGDLYLSITENKLLNSLWHTLDLAATDKETKAVRRQLAKPVVMVSFYGGEKNGILCTLWNKYNGEFEEGFDRNNNPTQVPVGSINIHDNSWLDVHTATTLIEAMSTVLESFPGFKRMRTWAKSNGSVIQEKYQEGFGWTTPTGFKATSDNISSAGFMPNFVHSIDGAIVQAVINNGHNEGIFVNTVHDAFFTTPNNALRLREIVQDAYKWVIENMEIPALTKKRITPDLELLEQIAGSTLIGESFEPKAVLVTA